MGNISDVLLKFGNVSDVLLKFQLIDNQYNTKELPPLFFFIHYRYKRFSSL